MKRAKYLSYRERREPEEISEVLGSVIESASVNIDVRQGELIDRWRQVVPGDWVEVARPVLVTMRASTTSSFREVESMVLSPQRC